MLKQELKKFIKGLGGYALVRKLYKLPLNRCVKLSRSYRKQRKYDKARSIAQKALNFYPSYLPLQIELAAIASDTENWTEALRLWSEILGKTKGKQQAMMRIRISQAYRSLGKFDEAIRVLEEGPKKHYPRSELELELARLASLNNDWTMAIEHWHQVLESADGEIELEAIKNLVVAQRSTDNLKSAEKTAQDGLKKYAKDPALLAELARIKTDKHQWKAALKSWHNLLDTVPTIADSERLKARFNISIIDRLLDVEKYKKQVEFYKSRRKKAKIAVFTAISGGYDQLKPPETLDPKIDYILFTDQPTENYGVFDIQPMPFFNEDPTRMARYVKTHPHQLLAEYGIAIWVDANIMITGDILPIINKFIDSKKAVGAIPHPLRDSIYEEGEECINRSKEDSEIIKEQLDHYQELGFDCNDLIESNFMVFNLQDPKIQPFLTTWWSEIDKFSRRDQLSLNYALDQNKTSWHRLMKRPQNVRNHPAFTLSDHKSESSALAELEKKLGGPEANPLSNKSFYSVKDRVVKANKKKHIDVVYAVHNALDDVKTCLASVRKHRINQNLKLIIVDDGSDKPTAEFLNKFQQENSSWVELLRSDKATGYTKAANRGIRASTGKLVILLNSDTVVTDGWTEKMADAVFSTNGAGIVGPLSSAASHQSIPNFISSSGQTATNELPLGLTADDMNRYCEEWAIADFYPRVPLVHGFCFGITREAIEKVGLFDEESFPNGYGEENDYCFRAVDAGFSLVIATNTYIYHAKSKSYPSERRKKLMEAGNQKLRELHGRERIRRAIISMQQNPLLDLIRSKTVEIYKQH